MVFRFSLSFLFFVLISSFPSFYKFGSATQRPGGATHPNKYATTKKIGW